MTPLPILFTLGTIPIYSHGLFFALGAETALLTLYFLARRAKLPTESISLTVVVVFVVGLLSARLGYVLLYLDEFNSLGEVVALWQGGLISYFGLLGGSWVTWLLFRRDPQWQLWFSLAVCALFAGWGIGRVGNFLAGDSIGILSSFWTYFYGRVPIQLFEMLLSFGLAGTGIFWFWREKLNWPRALGLLVLYFAGRFGIDFWRDESWLWLLKPSQWASLIAALTLLEIRRRYVK